MDGVEVFGKDGEENDGARIGDRQRDSLFMIAQLRLAGSDHAHDVRVRNLSVGGLMIEFDREVGVGDRVMLNMRGLGDVAGRVAWATHGRVGIALDAPIDPKKVRKPVGGRKAKTIEAQPIVFPRPR